MFVPVNSNNICVFHLQVCGTQGDECMQTHILLSNVRHQNVIPWKKERERERERRREERKGGAVGVSHLLVESQYSRINTSL